MKTITLYIYVLSFCLLAAAEEHKAVMVNSNNVVNTPPGFWGANADGIVSGINSNATLQLDPRLIPGGIGGGGEPLFTNWLGSNLFLKIEVDPTFTAWLGTNGYQKLSLLAGTNVTITADGHLQLFDTIPITLLPTGTVTNEVDPKLTSWLGTNKYQQLQLSGGTNIQIEANGKVDLIGPVATNVLPMATLLAESIFTNWVKTNLYQHLALSAGSNLTFTAGGVINFTGISSNQMVAGFSGNVPLFAYSETDPVFSAWETGAQEITVGSGASGGKGGVTIGWGANSLNDQGWAQCVAVGFNSSARYYSVSVGKAAGSLDDGVSIGYNSSTGTNDVSLGYGAIVPPGFTGTAEIGQGSAVSNGWLHFRGHPLFDASGQLGTMAGSNFLGNADWLSWLGSNAYQKTAVDSNYIVTLIGQPIYSVSSGTNTVIGSGNSINLVGPIPWAFMPSTPVTNEVDPVFIGWIGTNGYQKLALSAGSNLNFRADGHIDLTGVSSNQMVAGFSGNCPLFSFTETDPAFTSWQMTNNYQKTPVTSNSIISLIGQPIYSVSNGLNSISLGIGLAGSLNGGVLTLSNTASSGTITGVQGDGTYLTSATNSGVVSITLSSVGAALLTGNIDLNRITNAIVSAGVVTNNQAGFGLSGNLNFTNGFGVSGRRADGSIINMMRMDGTNDLILGDPSATNGAVYFNQSIFMRYGTVLFNSFGKYVIYTDVGNTNIVIGDSSASNAKIVFNNPPAFVANWNQRIGWPAATRASTNQAVWQVIDTNMFCTLTVKDGQKIRVDYSIQNFWNKSNGYGIHFSVGMDTNTSPVLSPVVYGYDTYVAAVGTTNNTTCLTITAFFNGVTAGTHTFFPIWHAAPTTTNYILSGTYVTVTVDESYGVRQ